MRSAMETTDLFRGAFYLCSGGSLVQVRLDEDNRRIVSFLIEGEDLDRLDIDYRNGQALVNPLQFRESLNHLRDILFNKLRDKREGDKNDRKRKYVEGPAESGAEDPDKNGNRKGKDRVHKGRR